AATGGRAEIGRFDFQLSTLTAHLYDITLHGSEPGDEFPLLHVDKITVELKIQSILRRKISLSQLLIEHPVANVQVDRNGKSTLPQSSHPQSGGSPSVFDLAAQHVLLTDGQVNYNDKSIPVEADLYGLKTEIHFVPETRYRGSISYDSGGFATKMIPPSRTVWKRGSTRLPQNSRWNRHWSRWDRLRPR